MNDRKLRLEESLRKEWIDAQCRYEKMLERKMTKSECSALFMGFVRYKLKLKFMKNQCLTNTKRKGASNGRSCMGAASL